MNTNTWKKNKQKIKNHIKPWIQTHEKNKQKIKNHEYKHMKISQKNRNLINNGILIQKYNNSWYNNKIYYC